ncbi:MAG TPA: ABC transporter ATP-binding protein [Anaerolineales bacterium]|jgi:ABC-type polysaccharide/polyol phosphate transport system ATPase subunit|nr:ABC transporter ATP-binding protein [Anaerolineales bacterium]
MNPVIILNNVSVKYRAPEEVIGTFKEYAIQVLKRNVRYREFMALNHIDLDVNEGEILGVIGRNGAGKSTLLKVISRVLIPTEGRVRIRGLVSPLLELGAGFHPELTGRENIFLNGTLLGHARQEIKSRLPEIIEFSELGAFIDSPLRTYSSGMVARLGFSIATTWKPEILVLDEVLSVGDEAFRHKCQLRMENFRDQGTTTLLVTHDSVTVETLCSRAVWLDHGKIKAMGAAKEVVAQYHRSQ